MPKIFNDISGGRKSKPEVLRLSDDVLFLSGAVRAAQNVPDHLRAKILWDIQDVLNCSDGELDFLFGTANDMSDVNVFDLPNAERRRSIIRYNLLDAAE